MSNVLKVEKATPGFEVKFCLKPELILNSNNALNEEITEKFSISAITEMFVLYLDTDSDHLLDKEGWNVRVRRKRGKKIEFTYKKRYPVVTTIEDTLTLAAKEGFDNNINDGYKIEVDWSLNRQTLSFSYDDKVSFDGADDELPSIPKAISTAKKKCPDLFEDWKYSNWGVNTLDSCRGYGIVKPIRYTGVFEDTEVDIEVWEILKEDHSGVEPVVEISLKTDNFEEAEIKRVELKDTLEEMGILLPVDVLKTQMILNRY